MNKKKVRTIIIVVIIGVLSYFGIKRIIIGLNRTCFSELGGHPVNYGRMLDTDSKGNFIFYYTYVEGPVLEGTNQHMISKLNSDGVEWTHHIDEEDLSRVYDMQVIDDVTYVLYSKWDDEEREYYELVVESIDEEGNVKDLYRHEIEDIDHREVTNLIEVDDEIHVFFNSSEDEIKNVTQIILNQSLSVIKEEKHLFLSLDESKNLHALDVVYGHGKFFFVLEDIYDREVWTTIIEQDITTSEYKQVYHKVETINDVIDIVSHNHHKWLVLINENKDLKVYDVEEFTLVYSENAAIYNNYLDIGFVDENKLGIYYTSDNAIGDMSYVEIDLNTGNKALIELKNIKRKHKLVLMFYNDSDQYITVSYHKKPGKGLSDDVCIIK